VLIWKCSYCAKGIEPELDACWNCGYSKDGEPPSLELVALLTAAKRDQKTERENEKFNRMKQQALARNEVTIVDIQIPFISMVILLVKLSLASIPALLIIGLLWALVGVTIFVR
jgi:hypothetical protein